MIPLGLGFGIVMAIGANALMGTAPENRTADAGAIQESAFALGAGTGIAVLGVIAVHHAAPSAAAPSAEEIYGAGVDSALGIAHSSTRASHSLPASTSSVPSETDTAGQGRASPQTVAAV